MNVNKKYSINNKLLGGINLRTCNTKSKKNKIDVTGRLDKSIVEEQLRNLSIVAFELTEDCNLSCEYCAYSKYYNFSNQREKKDISWNVVKISLDYIFEYKRNNSNLHVNFYGGEPLLKVGIIKQTVDYCNSYLEKNIHFSYGFTTNGLLLKNNIDFLIKNKFRILISLDGDKEANSFRVFNNGKESYDSLLKNIKYIKDKYPEFYKKSISFNTVLHQKNDIPTIIDFFDKKLNKKTNINSLAMAEISPLYKNEFMKDIFKDYYDDYNKNIKKISDVEGNIDLDPNYTNGIRLISNLNSFKVANYNELLPFYDKKEFKYIPTATCLPFSKKMFVTVKGDILPCERINFDYSLGNISEKKVNINFEKIANIYNKYYDKLKNQCEKCALSDNCQMCMFQLNMFDDNPKCHYFLSEKNTKLYYSGIIDFLEENPNKLKAILYETFTGN